MSIEYDSGHDVPRPQAAWENLGFWEGVKRHELVFQKCKDCGMWVHPPRPTCPRCRSLEREWAPSSGRGKVYSRVTYRESVHPAFKAPYCVILVELEEGVRLISNIVDAEPDEVEIGMPVQVVFEDLAEDLTLAKFKKV